MSVPKMITTRKRYTYWAEIGNLRVPCGVPTVDQKDKLIEKAMRVAEVKGKMVSQAGADAAFELLAEILSCNYNYVKYTAEELKKQDITVMDIAVLLLDWINFIGEIENSKN